MKLKHKVEVYLLRSELQLLIIGLTMLELDALGRRLLARLKKIQEENTP